MVESSKSFSLQWQGSVLEISLPERLTSRQTPDIWKQTDALLKTRIPGHILIQAKNLQEADSSAFAYLRFLKTFQKEKNLKFDIQGLDEKFKFVYDNATGETKSLNRASLLLRRPEKIGKYTVDSFREFLILVTFTGELTHSFWKSILSPSRIRWKDVFKVSEAMGVNAFPIIAMIGFLLGLIMSFQSAIPMRRFGAEIFVANLVGLSLFRELGPLMTAFILSGRSGSAFAAELGTMKVSEEIDALTTMGLPPVQFLVVPRLIASLLMTPFLTIMFNLFGLVGGAVVLVSFGFPLVTFINQVNIAVGFNDIAGGMLKSYFFGMIIAALGCYRGLRTTTGAGAVGESTTAAVVGSIILVSVLDGIFSVVYFYLGI
ncbi:ABC transporter membrane protein [Leptospira ryugenii]|uniref:ABC transporter membrane protein n=1 Tax=Leptospira ryugenii TaxID=1917863 RepID=A0A2P2E140_9LEPT|nr:ABC transporter permease [Leptospira ryugenii]GBF50600.1 ABC transporter membrane protein [Leptospira ryugenii]